MKTEDSMSETAQLTLFLKEDEDLKEDEEESMLSNLQDFYKDLQDLEEQPHRELIHQWPQELRDIIVAAFVEAVSAASVKGSVCPIKPKSTNQSIGNQVEKYIIPQLDEVLSGFSICKSQGSGYPDQILIQESTDLHMPLEVKTTSDWNKKDANRRVLTSSSEKLRAQFSTPIYHLLFTVGYSGRDDNSVTVTTIRLDFLEPTTVVNARFEASVSHKLLTNGSHYSKTI